MEIGTCLYIAKGCDGVSYNQCYFSSNNYFAFPILFCNYSYLALLKLLRINVIFSKATIRIKYVSPSNRKKIFTCVLYIAGKCGQVIAFCQKHQFIKTSIQPQDNNLPEFSSGAITKSQSSVREVKMKVKIKALSSLWARCVCECWAKVVVFIGLPYPIRLVERKDYWCNWLLI